MINYTENAFSKPTENGLLIFYTNTESSYFILDAWNIKHKRILANNLFQ